LLPRKILLTVVAMSTLFALGAPASNARATDDLATLPVYTASAMGVICDGTTDTTVSLQQAILVAESTGGTLVLPPGDCILSGSLEITKGYPITLAGAGIDVTTLVQHPPTSGILHIRVDHVTVEDMTLDNHLGGGVEIVASNYTTTQRIKALCGPDFFCLYFPGGQGATPDHPVYSEHNKLLDSIVYDTIQGDGISWSFQDHSRIDNLTHTGSRLSLYVVKNTVVNGYIYYPGIQKAGLTGWSVTTPSYNVTLENITTYGAGGKILPDPGNSLSRISENITIYHEVFENATGYRLSVDDVRGITISGTDFRGNQLTFAPSVTAMNVLVESSTIQAVRFAGAVNGKVSGAQRGTITNVVFQGDTFPAVDSPLRRDETFVNFTGGTVDFSVVGGSWRNEKNGFFRGVHTTCTVSHLRGFTGSSSPCS
jgi:hypothetical protein